jgi:hypothetical protein
MPPVTWNVSTFLTNSPLPDRFTQALSKRVLSNDLARSTKGSGLAKARLVQDFPATFPVSWIRGPRRMLNEGRLAGGCHARLRVGPTGLKGEG